MTSAARPVTRFQMRLLVLALLTSLFVLGALHRAPTFPKPPRPSRISKLRVEPWDVFHVHQNLAEARRRGLEDTPLIQAWRHCVTETAARLISQRPPSHERSSVADELHGDLEREVPRALGRWIRHPARWPAAIRRRRF